MGEDNHLKSVSSASVHEIKSDAVLAKEFKDSLRPLLEQQSLIMEQAGRLGMQLGWSVSMNQFGKYVVSEITVTKQL